MTKEQQLFRALLDAVLDENARIEIANEIRKQAEQRASKRVKTELEKEIACCHSKAGQFRNALNL